MFPSLIVGLAICLGSTAGLPHEQTELVDASSSFGVSILQVTKHVGTLSGVQALPPAGTESLLDLAFEEVAAAARAKLVAGAAEGAHDPGGWGSRFSAVSLALPVAAPVVNHQPSEDGKGFVEGGKNMLGERVLTKGGRQCVVYGIGINDDSTWEQGIAKDGCETHGFDCTLSPEETTAVLKQEFKFHDWCIGSRQGEGSVYAADLADKKFLGLGATMAQLGHSSVDVLKFDIEGFEWELFEDDILKMDNPPEQLVFELHTRGANPGAVPPRLVDDKGFRQVNQLFLQLYDMGYRVVSKEINTGDPYCSEFVLVNVQNEKLGT